MNEIDEMSTFRNPTPQGRLERIWIKRMRLGPMDPKDSARALVGRGLEGNADQGGKRQITVISVEAWAEAEAELGRCVAPEARRANLLVRGVDLGQTRDKVLRIGDLRLEIRGETRPCRRMDEAAEGLKQALSPDWRAGVYGQVLADADISVGDAVFWEE